ncbi:MAG: cytochrome c biogenesis protein ResB [Eubacteriales bacterium]
MIKKIGKFLSSMPFAIALLILLAAACAFSSTVTQGQSYEYYHAQYGERLAGLILALRLDDAFHSWWFIGLSAVLCLNLLCCNLIRLPSLMKRSRAFANAESFLSSGGGVTEACGGEPEKLMKALGMPDAKEMKTADGRRTLFSVRNRAGLWGAWVCHLGILLLILGFALGQMTGNQFTIYGLPGQTKPLGDTGLLVTVNDFQAELREDGSAEQFTADLTAEDPAAGTREHASASVNAPAVMYGYKFFQNSYGWGADIRITKDGQPLQTEAVCAGDFLAVKDKPELVIYFQTFYPDYVMIQGSGPSTQSMLPKNPAYLYRVYYQNQLLGMNALQGSEELTIDEYTVVFENPRYYTLLAVKRDHFTWLVLIGGIITLAGMVLAFYLRPTAVFAAEEEDGIWRVHAKGSKGGVLFRETFEKVARENGFTMTGENEHASG